MGDPNQCPKCGSTQLLRGAFQRSPSHTVLLTAGAIGLIFCVMSMGKRENPPIVGWSVTLALLFGGALVKPMRNWKCPDCKHTWIGPP